MRLGLSNEATSAKLVLCSTWNVWRFLVSIFTMNKQTKKPSAPVEVPRDVEVQKSLEVAHATMVNKLGVDIIRKTGEVAGLYLGLCQYIRQNKVAPKLVSFELTKLGFKRSRVSEINRVSQASDKLFTAYQAKAIGFDKCLEMARVEKDGEAPKLTEGARALIGSGELSETDASEALHASEPAAGGGGSQPSVFEGMKSRAFWILKNATRARHWNNGRWELRLVKVARTGPALGDEKE